MLAEYTAPVSDPAPRVNFTITSPRFVDVEVHSPMLQGTMYIVVDGERRTNYASQAPSWDVTMPASLHINKPGKHTVELEFASKSNVAWPITLRILDTEDADSPEEL